MLLVKLKKDAVGVVEGANLTENEYGALCKRLFFLYCSFNEPCEFNHLFSQCSFEPYERRGSYEMVEKVGLYWHFVI
jgi:cytochrome c oxidase subunit 3